MLSCNSIFKIYKKLDFPIQLVHFEVHCIRALINVPSDLQYTLLKTSIPILNNCYANEGFGPLYNSQDNRLLNDQTKTNIELLNRDWTGAPVHGPAMTRFVDTTRRPLISVYGNLYDS